MTRYKLNILDGDYGLDNKDISFLFGFLSAKITKNTIHKINFKIQSMQKNNRDYGLIQLSKNVLIGILKTKDTNSFINLGYPFPISIKKINTKFNGYTVNFYLRGENIRGRQRKYVFQCFQNAIIHKINKTNVFKKQLEKTYLKYQKTLIYVDLYRFIGDGILGLYFIDNFQKHFGAKVEQTHVFSRNNRHMPRKNNVHAISELTNFVQKHDYFTIVIPDLLDNQFNEFMDMVHTLKQKNVLIIIPSRNMYIEISEKGNQIFWYRSPDVLLTNQPIVDYMQQCMSAFIEKNKIEQVKIPSLNNNLFIDPFSSLKEKTIPFAECALLCKKLMTQGFRLFVSNGLNQDEYTNKLKKLGVKVVKDMGLNDLQHKLKKYNIGLIISTDSSVAHLSAYLHIPVIVLYRSYFWDPFTVQSMTNDSPGGFCRADLPMFPLVDATPDDVVGLLSTINQRNQFDVLEHEIEKFCSADDKTVLKTHNKLMSLITVKEAYNPDVLLRGILNKSKRHDTWQIAHNIWENLPEYKISKFYRC